MIFMTKSETNQDQSEYNIDDILKVQETVDVYRKTPLIRTTLLGSIIYEAGNMFYHFIAQKNSLTSYVNDNINFFNNSIVPTLKEMGNYTYENTGLSVLIASGIGFGWYLLEKGRNLIPQNTIQEIPIKSGKLEVVKELNYELDKKHYFLQDKIQHYINKYAKPFVYSFMAISAGVTTIGGTYGSFIKNGLNVFKNFPQVADSYSGFLLTAGAGVGFFSLRKFSEYAMNIGRGFYEKYLFVENKVTSLNEEKQVLYKTSEQAKQVKYVDINRIPRSEQVKYLENLVKTKNNISKRSTNKN